MLNLRVAASVCVALLSTRTIASAGPRLILAGDASGEPLRAVATDFAEKIAKADLEGAKRLFDGPPEQLTLLEVQVKFVAASRDFEQAVKARFGADAQHRPFINSKLFEEHAANMHMHPIILGSSRASVAGTSLLDKGLILQRTDGVWKVVNLAAGEWDLKAEANFFRWCTLAMDEARRDLAAGVFATVDAAEGDVDRRQRDGLRLRSDDPYPGVGPAPQPVQNPPRVEDLRGLIGHQLMSPEITQLLDSLPDVPYMSMFPDVAFIGSRETGVEMSFSLTNGLLRQVAVHADKHLGYAQYAGELPMHLTFKDRRKDVEQKVGRSPSGHGHEREYSAFYPTLGMDIEYFGQSRLDANAIIQEIEFLAPDPAGEPPATGRVRYVRGRLTFRLVAPPAAPLTPDMDLLLDPDAAPALQTLHVYKQPLLDETLVDDVFPSKTLKGDSAISFGMTADGAEVLKKVSDDHTGLRLAIVLDDQLLAAPTIDRGLGKYIEISCAGWSNERLQEFIKGVQKAVDSVPATEPTGEVHHR
jgi:hypothetical protein